MKLYVDENIYAANEIQKRTISNYVPGFDFDIYLPPNPAIKRPVLIALHAGGGKKDDNQPVTWAKTFAASAGWVGISAEYKEGTGDYDAEKQRLAAINIWHLNKWIRDNADNPEYRFKKRMIFSVGDSAGAITSLHSAIALNNRDDPYFTDDRYPEMKWPVNMRIAGAASLSGAATPKFLDFVDESDPPCFLYHGTEDPTIPYKNAVATFDKLDEFDTGSTLTSYEGEGHGVGHKDEIHLDLHTKFADILGNMVKDI